MNAIESGEMSSSPGDSTIPDFPTVPGMSIPGVHTHVIDGREQYPRHPPPPSNAASLS